MSFSRDPKCAYCPQDSDCGTDQGDLYCFFQKPIHHYTPTLLGTFVRYVGGVALVALVIALLYFAYKHYKSGRLSTITHTLARWLTPGSKMGDLESGGGGAQEEASQDPDEKKKPKFVARTPVDLKKPKKFVVHISADQKNGADEEKKKFNEVDPEEKKLKFVVPKPADLKNGKDEEKEEEKPKKFVVQMSADEKNGAAEEKKKEKKFNEAEEEEEEEDLRMAESTEFDAEIGTKSSLSTLSRYSDATADFSAVENLQAQLDEIKKKLMKSKLGKEAAGTTSRREDEKIVDLSTTHHHCHNIDF